MILPSRVHGDDSNASGVLWLFDKMSVNPGSAGKFMGARAKGIGTDRTAKQSGNTRASCSHRLIESFSTGAGSKIADNFVAWTGKLLHIEREVLVETADD